VAAIVINRSPCRSDLEGQIPSDDARIAVGVEQNKCGADRRNRFGGGVAISVRSRWRQSSTLGDVVVREAGR
jgi:hypothetical protein